MSKIKVGVIGCGTIANAAHIPSYMKLSDQVQILYFCDIIPERAEKAVREYGCGKAVTDYHEVLSDPKVQAVSVCTPNDVHAKIAIDAMRAGKDVLCEKPAARTYEEALTMQKAQHETGRILNIGVVNRYNDSVRRIKEYIDQGALGEVYSVYVSFRSQRCIPGLGGSFTKKAVAGGGVLIDWGVHYLDLVMYCVGDPKPLTVSGETFCKLGADMKHYVYTSMWSENTKDIEHGTYDVEDAVVGLIRTDGPVITLNGAWAENIGPEERYIDFLGTKAGIRLMYGGDFELFGTENGALTQVKPSYTHSDMFLNEISAFVDDVKTREPLPSRIDVNIKTSQLMQAVYDSAAAHREIVLA